MRCAVRFAGRHLFRGRGPRAWLGGWRRAGRELGNLDIALANMAHGLAMFDADERLVLANARYAEIYGLGPEHLRPGMTLRELIEHRIAKGLYPGITADDVIANMRERVAIKSASHLVSRPGDGRVLSVSIHPRKEGGWVVTLQDITEREELNARLVEQNQLLKQREQELNARNEQLDAALENMSQGLAMYDAEQRLIVSNRRYAEMYGLTPEQVKPGTTVREVFDCTPRQRPLPRQRPGGLRRRAGRAVSARSPRASRSWHDGRIISVLRRRTGQRRPRHHARGHHRAPAAACAGWSSRTRAAQAAGGEADRPERPARCGAEEHAAGPGHVRRRASARHLQQALCRDVRPVARAGEAAARRCARSSSIASPTASSPARAPMS